MAVVFTAVEMENDHVALGGGRRRDSAEFLRGTGLLYNNDAQISQ